MQLDPRTKLLATIILIIATFLTTQATHFIGIACLFIIILIVSKTPLALYLRHIVLLSWLLLFTFLAHFWGSTSAIQEGVVHSFLIVGQLVVVVGWVTILGASSSPLAIVHGLERLFRPGQRIGLPVQKLTLVTMLSIRFLPIIFEEGEHLVHAYIARGIDLKGGNLLVRLKNYILLCIPLLSSMLRRVEHISLAMESRAFCAGSERTSLHEFRITFIDYVVLGGSLLIMACTQIFS